MSVGNIFHLGVKELYSLLRDPILLILIIYAFSLAIYSRATTMPETLHNAPIAIIDEDRSQLSSRIRDAFYTPYFKPPILISRAEMDKRMDVGLDTFALNIPSGFQRDVLAGRSPKVQLNIDATRMGQAFSGNGYIQSIINSEVNTFLHGHRSKASPQIDLNVRVRFNPELNKGWFGGVMELIDKITMLAIILTGAALIREREHGTVEHLLVMPVTPLEIITAKVWAMALVVLVASACSLVFVIEGGLKVPIEGSIPLFLAGTTIHLFASASLGIFLSTIARSMPQFGLLLMLVLLPLQILSGSVTPRESMPDFVQYIMLVAPNTHFVSLAQAILYRGADFTIVWPEFLSLGFIGGVLFGVALVRFRKTLSTIA